jgi:hypothetical protein
MSETIPSWHGAQVKENETVRSGRKQRAVALTSCKNIENVKRKAEQKKNVGSLGGMTPLRSISVNRGHVCKDAPSLSSSALQEGS